MVVEPSIKLPLPTNEELNALRYAAGYVLRSLTIKYKSSTKSSRDKVLVTLSDMQANLDDSDDGDDGVRWTTEWTTRLDRGKLVKVSDLFYALLLAIEMKVRLFFNYETILQTSLSEDQILSKEELMTAAFEDGEVQFYWCLMAVDLDYDANEEMLHKIIKLWVTIRGFSFTKSWLEKYKANQGRKGAKCKGLRKELKQKDDN